MKTKFHFVSYEETIDNYYLRGDYFRKKSISQIFKEIVEIQYASVNVLDFIGVEVEDFDGGIFAAGLQEAIEAYEDKYNKNLPLIFTNISKDLWEVFNSLEAISLTLKKNHHVIPVFDDYGVYSHLIGIDSIVVLGSNIMSKNPIEFNHHVPEEIIKANSWLFNKKGHANVMAFSTMELINNLNTYIIADKLNAWKKNIHIQIAGYHSLETILPDDLFSRKDFNAWWGKIVYSKFKDETIDIIVSGTIRSSVLAYEIKTNFLSTKNVIQDLIIDFTKTSKGIIEDSYLQRINGKKILVVLDSINYHDYINMIYDTIKHSKGTIVGIVTIFKNVIHKTQHDKIIFSLVESPVKLFSFDECPECLKKNGKPLHIMNLRTEKLVPLSLTNKDYNELLSNNSANDEFWNIMEKTNSFYPHIINKKNGVHYYYYFNALNFISEHSDKLDWDISSLYKDAKWPDTILFVNNPASFLIVSKLLENNKYLHKATLLPVDERSLNYKKVLKLKERRVLIVQNSNETGKTRKKLTDLCEDYDRLYKNVKIFILIDRLAAEYRQLFGSWIGSDKIFSAYKVPIPSYKYDRDRCPICTEIKYLEKYYDKLNFTARRYVNNRLTQLKPVEIDPEEGSTLQSVSSDVSERVKQKEKFVTLFYSKGETAFFEAIKHGIQNEKMFHILEDMPSEYMYVKDVSNWLSSNIDKTNNVEHLTCLLRATLRSDVSIIVIHLQKIIQLYILSGNIDFLSYFLEYLIFEGIITKKSLRLLLNEIDRKSSNNADIIKELRSSVLDEYPAEIMLRPSLVGIYEDIITKVANTDVNILITGETGTGKREFAKMIHKHSDRSKNKFILVDMTTVPETLIESELFGHEKGAFTGATNDRDGKIKLSDGGTLFLDEIGLIPISGQGKLLTVLDDKEFFSLGGKEPIKSNFRLICATNIPIQKYVENNQFRRDLYYRINTIHIKIPPLRKTPGDISRLAKHYLEMFCRQYNRPYINYSNRIDEILKAKKWLGNVRELKNFIEKTVILSENGQPNYDLIEKISSKEENYYGQKVNKTRENVISVLQSTSGNVRAAAKILNITREYTYQLIRNLNINRHTEIANSSVSSTLVSNIQLIQNEDA